MPLPCPRIAVELIDKLLHRIETHEATPDSSITELRSTDARHLYFDLIPGMKIARWVEAGARTARRAREYDIAGLSVQNVDQIADQVRNRKKACGRSCLPAAARHSRAW